MEKIEDICLTKRILDFLAKRIGAEKIEPYYSCHSSSIDLTSVHKTETTSVLTDLHETLHFQIDNIFVKTPKSLKDPDECLLYLVNKMFEKAQTKDIVSSFDGRIVLRRHECLENILIEMDLMEKC